MSRSFRLSQPTHVARIRRVDVCIHWSVFLIAGIMLAGNLRRPLVTAIGLAAWLGVLIIHEVGHLVLAKRLGYDAFGIEIYPVAGLALFENPHSRYDHALIAWGGVPAQAAVAIPLVLDVAVLGYTPFESLNVVLAILGYFSLSWAVFNLLPVGRLDGSIAWYVIPDFIARWRARRKRRVLPYRSPR